MKDLIIIGAAAAGTAAGIYAARRKLDFKIISKDIGGEVALSGEIENWPGTIHTTGVDLADDFHEHLKSYNVKIEKETEVIDLKPQKNHVVVKYKDPHEETKEEKTKAVIIATGITPIRLDIPGEKKLRDKGVTYCTVCDGPLFKGKTTATIGAGNSALESSLMLAEIAETAHLVTKYPNKEKHKGGFPKGDEVLIHKAKNHDNIKIIYDAMTEEIIGNSMVKGIKYRNQSTDETEKLELDGVMIHIGMSPNSDFIDCIDKNKTGEIKIDKLCRTDCRGIFAAGDVTDVPYKQIAVSTGLGTTAALSAIDYINKLKDK